MAVLFRPFIIMSEGVEVYRIRDVGLYFNLLYFELLMQSIDRLFTNTTNRYPLVPLAIHHSAPQQPTAQQSKKAAHNYPPQLQNQLALLSRRQQVLHKQILSAQQEHHIIMELFEEMSKVERGEHKQTKKFQRRCNIDILDKLPCNFAGCNRFYSSENTLQRHIKLKHRMLKHEPPQLYHDLHPQPNLTTELASDQLDSNADRIHPLDFK